jgi:hypothetical protein
MEDYDNLSDDVFCEARLRHRQVVVQYVRDQPHLATHPQFGGWFADADFEFLVNNSCRDLLRGLGMIRLAESYNRSLGPVMLEYDWKRPPQELLRPPKK